jgi:transcriptional regulator with XRE-family HTH domain|uniref:Helix-turn-helix domain protein n=1 Tax=Siphoviridae sp. ctbxa26 TaxID=2825568 RepID=A0A8S5VEP0_9CAUD|nr:MAG TPA: helix-turn-helix domain protein [Siphoviridae sp. ctbxa26]
MNITQERIKEAIKNSGLSYRELAEKIGISSTSIYRYVQKSVDKIPLFVIEKIANVTNTDVKWLMGWDEKPESHIKQELHDYIDTIDDEKLEKAFIILKTLNEEL